MCSLMRSLTHSRNSALDTSHVCCGSRCMISTEKRPSRQLPITLERGRFRDRYLAFNRLTALVFPAKYKTVVSNWIFVVCDIYSYTLLTSVVGPSCRSHCALHPNSSSFDHLCSSRFHNLVLRV